MKKYLLQLALVIGYSIISFLPASCLKEDNKTEPEDRARAIKVTGENISPDTKTTLSGVSTVWIANTDEVGIYSPEARPTEGGAAGVVNALFTADASTTNSTFTGDMFWGTGLHNFYAYYPYVAGSAARTVVPISLPSAQTQNGNSSAHIGTYDFTVATPLTNVSPGTVDDPTTVNFQYNHVFAMLELKILSETSVNITEVKVSAGSGNNISFTSGTIDITQARPAAGVAYTLAGITGSSNEITLTITGGVTLTNDAGTTPPIYITMLPVDLSSDNILITIKRSDGYYYYVNKPGKNFTRGVKHTATITSSQLGVASMVLTGAANSYIINPQPSATSFSIPITQSNNYWSSSNYGNTPANVIASADKWVAQIIWNDVNNLLTLNNSGKSVGPNGRILVQVPSGSAGNALIGIKRDSNGDGVPDVGASFLWSWHIWVTDYNPNGTQTAVDAYKWTVTGGAVYRYNDKPPQEFWTGAGIYVNSSVKMMDRNMGARSTAYSSEAGILFYQFGRKDPLPATATLYNGTVSSVAVTAGAVSMNTAVSNPATFYTFNGNWCTSFTGTTYLWNDVTATPISAGAKGIFDPCPVGWRMPITGTYSDFTKTGTFPWTTNLRTYSAITGTPLAIYPASGYRDAATGAFTSVGTWHYSYSASPYTTAGNGYAITFDASTVGQGGNVLRAYGCTVRCIKEL